MISGDASPSGAAFEAALSKARLVGSRPMARQAVPRGRLPALYGLPAALPLPDACPCHGDGDVLDVVMAR
jgi:hypothetical protein